MGQNIDLPNSWGFIDVCRVARACQVLIAAAWSSPPWWKLPPWQLSARRTERHVPAKGRSVCLTLGALVEPG